MKMTTINQQIEQLKQNRTVGMEGLPFDKVRTSQVKTRFTLDESEFLSVLAHEVDAQKAVLCNVLIIQAVIALLKSEPDLRDQVLRAWQRQGGERLDFFDEIENHKPFTVEGELDVVAPCSRSSQQEAR